MLPSLARSQGVGADVCLAEYCDILQCNVEDGRAADAAEIALHMRLNEALCRRVGASQRRSQCMVRRVP